MEGEHESSWGDAAARGNSNSYYLTDTSSTTYTLQERRSPPNVSINAYLGLAFNSGARDSPYCTTSSSVGVDSSLLRCTHSHGFSSSSISFDERTVYSLQFQQLHAPGASFSTSPLRPVRESRTPQYCTRTKNAVMEDGVLVIGDGFDGDNWRVLTHGGGLPFLGSHSSTTVNSGGKNGSGNRRNSFHGCDGTGFFLGAGTGRRRSDEEDQRVGESHQMRRRSSTPRSMRRHWNRDTIPCRASPSSTGVLLTTPDTARPAIPATLGGNDTRPERSPPDLTPLSSAIYTTAADGVPVIVPPTQGVPMPRAPPASTFAWPPTMEEAAEIQRVSYGPRRRRRLHVFTQICPED